MIIAAKHGLWIGLLFPILMVGIPAVNDAIAEEVKIEKEPPANPLRYWLTLGPGWSKREEGKAGIGGLAGVSLQKDKYIFSLRHVSYQEGNFFTEVIDCIIDNLFEEECHRGQRLRIDDSALMVGRALRNDRIIFSTGVSRVRGDNTRDTDKDFLTVGFPIELQLRLPSQHFGLGMTFQGNLNRKVSYGGVYITLQMGKLK